MHSVSNVKTKLTFHAKAFVNVFVALLAPDQTITIKLSLKTANTAERKAVAVEKDCCEVLLPGDKLLINCLRSTEVDLETNQCNARATYKY